MHLLDHGHFSHVLLVLFWHGNFGYVGLVLGGGGGCSKSCSFLILDSSRGVYRLIMLRIGHFSDLMEISALRGQTLEVEVLD